MPIEFSVNWIDGSTISPWIPIATATDKLKGTPKIYYLDHPPKDIHDFLEMVLIKHSIVIDYNYQVDTT